MKCGQDILIYMLNNGQRKMTSADKPANRDYRSGVNGGMVSFIISLIVTGRKQQKYRAQQDERFE